MESIKELVLIDIDHINKSIIRQSKIDSFVKQNDGSSNLSRCRMKTDIYTENLENSKNC